MYSWHSDLYCQASTNQGVAFLTKLHQSGDLTSHRLQLNLEDSIFPPAHQGSAPLYKPASFFSPSLLSCNLPNARFTKEYEKKHQHSHYTPLIVCVCIPKHKNALTPECVSYFRHAKKEKKKENRRGSWKIRKGKAPL